MATWIASLTPTCGKMWAGKKKLSEIWNYAPASLAHSSKFPFFLLLALILTGCGPISLVTLSDPEASQEHWDTYVASASPGQTIGQTFTTRRPRLNGLTLWINPSNEEGALEVALYHTPGDETPLITQVIPYADITNGVLHIRLPAGRGGSETRPYYILLRPGLGTTIQVRGREEDIYPGGQAFSGQTPLQADLAFTTSYDYDLAALLADLRLSLPRGWLALPLLAILYLPGWLLLDISGLGRCQDAEDRLDWGERTGLAIGLSLAIIPLAMLWSTTLGLRWGCTGLLIASALLLAAALWRIVSRISYIPANWADEGGSTPSSAQLAEKGNLGMLRGLRPLSIPKLPNLALAGIFLLTLGMRLVMARDLSAPAWVDSVHHAAITRLILEQGGFPSSYAPYIEIDATEYHAGFHSILAAFQWLSGLETPEAMLLLGQVLNALIVFAVYLLAVTLTRQQTAGLAAAAIAALFTPMPAYYTSWGRYTHLAGLLILPAGLALARLFICYRRGAKYCVSTLVITAIACGGLFLVHYRVAGFLALVLLCYFLSQVRFSLPAITRLVKRTLLFTGAAGLLALLLTLPWSWRAITQVFAPKAAVVGGSSARAFDGFFWDYLTAAWGLPAMVLAALGFLVSLFRRPSLAFSMALWTGSLLLAGNLSALHLPGGWFVNNISVAITLFMPTAVLAGYALAQAYTLLQALVPSRGKIISRGAFTALGLVVALLAARALLPILRPSTNLFRLADRPAIAWIAANLPADETILINPMFWGYGTYAGADGGYWITPLTGRKTIPPPVLYSLGSPDEKQRIRTLCDTVISSAADAAGLADYLRDQNLHYIYLGVRGGKLSPQALQESDQFEVLYAKDGAWVFAVR